MEPKPIPERIIRQGIGQPMHFGPPEGKEDEVGDLFILLLEDMKALLQGRKPDSARWVSWWQPTEEEREAIAKGGMVRLTILGATQINPMMLDVASGLEGVLFSEEKN